MKCKYSTVLFDLDGTLSDSAQGVQDGIVSAMKVMNMPVPDLSDRSLYIGPPLLSTFKKICGLTHKQAKQALLHYREAYEKDGKYKNYLYTGMDALLRDLKESGATVVVTTSKFELFAYEVLDYLNISQYFDLVCGSNLDGSRREKADVIRHAAQLLKCKITKDMVLVGDTAFDAQGALDTGCDFIAVTYGFGNKEEMIRLGADKLSPSVEGLREFLFD